jgi:hypothetical protein
MVAIATSAAAQDLADACDAFGSSEVIFVGRVKPATITRRVSGDDAIEKAQSVADAAERELKAFEAQKTPRELGANRHRELTLQMLRARQALDTARAMYPPPFDLSLTPLIVETAFRGVPKGELFLMNKGQPALDPGRSYLFYAHRPLVRIAPDVIVAGGPKELEAADADLNFLREALADDRGTVVRGSLILEDPDNHRRSPLPGVVLRVSLNGQHYETSTREDGTFMLTGVPPGMLRIEPVLPDNLALPHEYGRTVKGGCLAIHMRAIFNGRIRGKVLLDNGAPFPSSAPP